MRYKVGQQIIVVANKHCNNYKIGNIYTIVLVYLDDNPIYTVYQAVDEKGWRGNWLRGEEIQLAVMPTEEEMMKAIM